MKQLLRRTLQPGLIKQCLTIALLILLHCPGSAPAQDVEQTETSSPTVTYGFETDFNRLYVHRGLAFSQGPVNQSTAWVTISGLTFYSWGNLVLGRRAAAGGTGRDRLWRLLRVPVETADPGAGVRLLYLPLARHR